jgi:hypothetical protein
MPKLELADVAIIFIGRVCGESESIAPTVTIKVTSKSSAISRISRENDFQRIDGSTPVTITKSLFIEGIDNPKI